MLNNKDLEAIANALDIMADMSDDHSATGEDKVECDKEVKMYRDLEAKVRSEINSNLYLFRMIDEARAFYITSADNEENASKKVAEYLKINELGIDVVSDVAVLEDDIEIIN